MEEDTNTQTPTMKESAIWAWGNTPNRDSSPLLITIGEAIESMPDDDHSWDGNRHMRKTAKRIAAGREDLKFDMSIPPALDRHYPWTGEWEVKNKDLIAWGDFRMWLTRANADRDGLLITFQDITKSLGLKRLSQAYQRYLKSGLTDEHCCLLANMRWEMDMFRGDWTSLFVQGKRPLGNSSIAGDICKHAGWEWDVDEDDEISDDQEERAWNLFDELVFAAPDAAKMASLSLGAKNA